MHNLLPRRLLLLLLGSASLLAATPQHLTEPLHQSATWLFSIPLAHLYPNALSLNDGLGAFLRWNDQSREIRRLREQVQMLNARYVRTAQTVRHLQKQLQDLSKGRSSIDTSALPPIQPVRTMGQEPGRWPQGLWIDQGARTGLAPGMPVCSGDLLIGKIARVASHHGIVRLVTDPASRILVRVLSESEDRKETSLSNRRQGILLGTGSASCRLDYLPLEEPVHPGDWVLSTGSDGQYPPDLVIGEVVRVSQGSLFHEIEVRPMADLDRLENAQVWSDLRYAQAP
jgi:rod shape-determining protein MreC